MKLLFVAPYTPSPIRVRTYQLLRHLATRGCQITLVALEDAPLSAGARAELATLCHAVHLITLPKRAAQSRCLVALPTPKPLWVAYCQSPLLYKTIVSLCASEHFDAAHVEHLRAAWIRPALGDLPTILDAVDCITALQRQMFEQGERVPQRMLAWEEWSKLRHWEPRAYRPYARVAVTSSFDASALRALGLEGELSVIPNGVDLEYFQPQPLSPKQPCTLVFSGKMSYRANDDAALWFASTLWPRLKEQCPGVRWVIVGSDPSQAVRQLALDPAIEVTGYVEDIRPYLSRASVAICPLRIGVGIQNKALEAMAMGLPVVATPIAGRALQGASLDGGMTIAESDTAFVQACVELLTQPEHAQTAGVAARRYVERHHQWSCAADRFLDLYDNARAAA